MGFTKPLFLIKAKNVRAESLGQDGKHLRFISGDWSGKINAFGFGEFRRELMGHNEVSFVAELTEEVWMKKKSIVLTVKDIVVE